MNKQYQIFQSQEKFVCELRNNQHIKTLRKRLPFSTGRCRYIGILACENIYSIIREIKPDIIVETGIDRGVSTTYILLALQKNGKGKLISVDKNADAGKLVPQELKQYWEQKVGKTSDILPKLDIDLVDIFLHDSLHTYENMLFEYRWAYSKLAENGCIMSHDIGTNNSFYDFAKEVESEVQYVLTAKNRYGVGVITKYTGRVRYETPHVLSC